MNAEKYNLERIYFGGCFIRGMFAFLVVHYNDATMGHRGPYASHASLSLFPNATLLTPFIPPEP